MTSPEESFAIEIVDNDFDALNVKKITSEKVNNEKLLVKADCSKRTTQTVWFGIVGIAATKSSNDVLTH